jgi:hypothetical protein
MGEVDDRQREERTFFLTFTIRQSTYAGAFMIDGCVLNQRRKIIRKI